MNNKNQIFVLEEFFISDQTNLIINELNEQINEFYLGLVRRLANDKKRLVISVNDKIENKGLDLFGTNEIFSYNTKNKKDISRLILSSEKKIIFTDYKNYKNFRDNCITINTYQYEHDIKSVIKNYFKINNENLISFCLSNPESTMYEIMKYQVNSNNYNSETKYIQNKNFILDIRKDIYKIKSKNTNLKKAYELNKKEALFKKLNFLVY